MLSFDYRNELCLIKKEEKMAKGKDKGNDKDKKKKKEKKKEKQ